MTDSSRDFIPAYRTMTLISMADRYSILPYPKGCLRSAGFPASFVPTMVIREDPASDRLFTASMVMATEPVIPPITALNAARTTLARMPMIPVRIMIFSRTSCFSPSLISFIPVRPFSTSSAPSYPSQPPSPEARPGHFRPECRSHSSCAADSLPGPLCR